LRCSGPFSVALKSKPASGGFDPLLCGRMPSIPAGAKSSDQLARRDAVVYSFAASD
jgi:hypothetical protein